MAKTKVVFIGNPISGDDGIGLFLYHELKKEKTLDNYELIEAGTIGIDLVSLIKNGEKVIIVDAICSSEEVGKVGLIDPKKLKPNTNLVSPHDFGVEETLALIKTIHPKTRINIIGISIKEPKAFCDGLSKGLMTKMPRIKEEIIGLILKETK